MSADLTDEERLAGIFSRMLTAAAAAPTPLDSVKVPPNAAIKLICVILERLPDEESRKAVLESVLKNRCRKCLDFDASGSFWCCYESRGG